MGAAFERYIGVDYSGAETPESSLTGLRMYLADRNSPPLEVMPPAGPRKYWNRREIAERLVEMLCAGTPTLVGIDHGFSFPVRYFKEYKLPLDWPLFLEDFQRHWPTDTCGYVDFVRDGLDGNGAARAGKSTWRRLAEVRAGRAKSVFHFDAPGSVAKSTHSGLPWLRYIQRRAGAGVHFWPFDGWDIPAGKSAVAEVYPALWNKTFPQQGRNGHQQDAYCVAAWLRGADTAGTLSGFLYPDLQAQERRIAEMEGWILGVV
jgi:hypothetical protein